MRKKNSLNVHKWKEGVWRRAEKKNFFFFEENERFERWWVKKKYEKFAPYIQIYIERVMHQRESMRNRKVEKYKRTVWRIIHSAEDNIITEAIFFYFDSPAFTFINIGWESLFYCFFFSGHTMLFWMLYMLYTLEWTSGAKSKVLRRGRWWWFFFYFLSYFLIPISEHFR